jgi:hypothetical protein
VLLRCRSSVFGTERRDAGRSAGSPLPLKDRLQPQRLPRKKTEFHLRWIRIFRRATLIPSAAVAVGTATAILQRPPRAAWPALNVSRHPRLRLTHQRHVLVQVSSAIMTMGLPPKGKHLAAFVPVYHSSAMTPSLSRLQPQPRICGGRGERQLFESMLGMLSPRRVFTAKFDRTPKIWMKHCITSPNPAVSGITATRCCSLAAHPQVKSCTSCGRCVCCSMHGSRSSIFARLH